VHELSIATAILETALRHADGRPVSTVAVRDTVCEGAELTLTEVTTVLRCRDCDMRWSPEIPAFRCPACGGADVEFETGQELEVDYIEVEQEEEAACIAPR
jgi:Zn finger protein HypA/HybF involved in hydrogenase expression